MAPLAKVSVYYVWDRLHGPLLKVLAEYSTEAEVDDEGGEEDYEGYLV